MADETTPQTLPLPETPAAPAPPPEPTRGQAESKEFVKQTSDEIDDLWGKLDDLRTDKQPTAVSDADADADTPTVSETTGPGSPVRDDKGRFLPKSAAPSDQTVPPAGEAQPATTPEPTPEQRAYDQARARIEDEQRAEWAARQRIEQEQRFAQEVGYYAGFREDKAAVREALRLANLGDMRALDALDVTLPNGKRVSQVRENGQPGLTPEEATNLEIAWENADKYGDALSARKVQGLIGYWDQQVVSALSDPDVDATRVRSGRTPGEQLKAAIDTTRATVTARLAAEHAKALEAKDAEIAKLNERVTSLVTERGNLTSAQRAAQSATPDRPGAPGNLRNGTPTPEEFQAMDAHDPRTFEVIDRLFERIPGAETRRRAG